MQRSRLELWQDPELPHPVVQFLVGDYRNLVYLLVDWASRTAFVVDPHAGLSKEVGPYIAEKGLRLAGIALTHTHWDHISGIRELLVTAPTLPIFVHELDRHRLAALEKEFPDAVFCAFSDALTVGKLTLGVIHAPGHSAGEICISVPTTPPCLLTGDTLFVRECGRTDLETGSDEAMYATLQSIKRLDPTTILFPGHHYAREYWTVLGDELGTSPPLMCQSVDELRSLP